MIYTSVLDCDIITSFLVISAAAWLPGNASAIDQLLSCF